MSSLLQKRANVKTDALTELGEKLSAAIQAGDTLEATHLVTQMSSNKLKLDIRISKEEQDQRSKEQEFSVKVHMEDRISDGCFFSLLVKACDTILDLKRKIMLKYNIPVEVQRWIIGKKIPENEMRLSQCGVKGPGHTLYLYLVTARSVGLTKQDYESRGQNVQIPDLYWSMLESLCENHSSSPSPVLDSTSDLGMGEMEHGSSPYGPARQTSKKSLTSGNSLVQEMLLAATGPIGGESQSKLTSVEGGGHRMNDQPSAQRFRIPPSFPAQESERIGWGCPSCTFINRPTRPGCEMCSADRPLNYKVPPGYQMTTEEQKLLENERRLEQMTREAEQLQLLENYQQLIATDDLDLIANTEPFECSICFDNFDVGQGILLRDCLHMFCRDCLAEAVRQTEEPILRCPFQDGFYSCESVLQEREVRALVSHETYLKYLQRGLDQAELRTANSYHCKTADCHGWCVYEDLVNFFRCEVCGKENCLTCKAIHEGLNCKQYQEDLKLRAQNDAAAKQTADLLQKLVADGEAMHCPQCQVVVQKKGGCDWLRCSFCKTEICWVTKGPRWGPQGEGDTSGGCRCRVNGNKCHPNCLNCH